MSIRTFSVGDQVEILAPSSMGVGTVIAVWPAIEMLDVRFLWGDERVAMKEVLQVDPANLLYGDFPVDTGEMVMVSEGGRRRASRHAKAIPTVAHQHAPHAASRPLHGKRGVARIASSYLAKTALYWAAEDRKYRCNRSEYEEGSYTCPRDGYPLQRTIYKREGGKSLRLLACKRCLFLIKESDILSDHCDPCK
jgi:hypothetical protein